MANKPGYFAEYYAKNKKRMSAERKRRYKQDPEYRERALQASRDYRERQRDDDGGVRIRLPRYQKPITATVGDGSKIALFSVGAFAVYLGRSVQAVTHWEKAGVLPQTPYRNSRGFRFYTADMMAAVKKAVGSRRRLAATDSTMSDGIRRAWEQLGVPVKARSLKAALAATSVRRVA